MGIHGAAMDIVQRSMKYTMAKPPLVLDDGPAREGREEKAWPDLCDARRRLRRGVRIPPACRYRDPVIGPAARGRDNGQPAINPPGPPAGQP
jgi:hypothetical protein